MVMKNYLYFGELLFEEVCCWFGFDVVGVVKWFNVLCMMFLCVFDGCVSISFDLVMYFECVGFSFVCVWMIL